MLRLGLVQVFVDDQARALEFYTSVLGFEPRADVPLGADRWLTVGTPGQDGVELLLEPSGHPAVAPFRAALSADGIPQLLLTTDDLEGDVRRLERAGVIITQPPVHTGAVTIAVFDDTCGNLVVLSQPD